MKLTPLDIHHKEFRNALRGYSPEEVDDFLDDVADEFERLFKENIELSEQLDAANERIRSYAELERTLQNTLVSAQASAEDTRARAEQEGARLVRESEEKAAEIVSGALEEKQHTQAEIARLQSAEDEFRARFRRMLEGYLGGLAGGGDARATVTGTSVALAPENAPVAVPEPVETSAPEPAPVRTAAVAAPKKPAPVDPNASVVALTLGEVGDSEPVEADVPTLEVPAEFAFPGRGPVGELDDLDIEEID